MHGEVGKSVGVLFSPDEIILERTVSILRESSETFVEHDAIFEGCIHPLAIERHNGMGGVAEQRDFVPVKPGRTADRD